MIRSGIIAVLLIGLAHTPTWASDRTYGLDEDPIRQGAKALEGGDLAKARSWFDEAVNVKYQVDRALFGLGRVLVREGRHEQAADVFRQALDDRHTRTHADYPEARAQLGMIALRGGDNEAAAQAFDMALASDPQLWQALYGKAHLLLQNESWAEGKRLMNRGRDRAGIEAGEDLYHYGMGLHALGVGELLSAEKEALTALHLNPAEPLHAELVARVYEERGTPALAISAYEQALATPGVRPTAPLHCALGALYQNTKRYNEARDQYLAAVAVDSTYAPGLLSLADLLRLAKRHESAARTYMTYVGLRPHDLGALVNLAESCIEIRRYDQAVDAARAALALDESSTAARLGFARAAIRSEDPAVQTEAAETWPSLPPSTPWTTDDWLTLARFHSGSRRYAAARDALQAAEGLHPDDADIHFQRGILELKAGETLSALEHLNEAIRLRPDAAVYHLNLGIALFRDEQIHTAIPTFRRSLALRPDLTAARLLLAQALAASDSIASAETEYRNVLTQQPDNAKALRGLGFCRIRGGNYGRAVQAYQRATELDPSNADGWAGLGNAYLARERWAAAEQAFEQARRIDPQNATMQQGLQLLRRARARLEDG